MLSGFCASSKSGSDWVKSPVEPLRDVLLLSRYETANRGEMVVSSFSYAVGFGLALVLFAGVRERILLARVPKPLQDTSIGLVTAGMLSLAFFAFKGMV